MSFPYRLHTWIATPKADITALVSVSWASDEGPKLEAIDEVTLTSEEGEPTLTLAEFTARFGEPAADALRKKLDDTLWHEDRHELAQAWDRDLYEEACGD